ncbi:MAG TPA: ion transporter [Chromatiales bacterium]|nr:ion transporter [Thiotrichales bacterium]HIP68680.1 ion transporter [Chromatiales bacterium]
MIKQETVGLEARNGSLMRKRVFSILEISGPGDLLSRLADFILIVLIVASVVANILASVQDIYTEYEAWLQTLELVTVAVFSVEYILRIWSCVESPDPRFHQQPLWGRVRYALSPMVIIDLLAILPFYLVLWMSVDLMFLRVFRLFRIFKLTRYSPAMGLLLTVLRKESKSFGAAMFIMLVVLVIVASGIYLVENEAQPEAFASIPAAMWWAVATLTTVGYGDVTPITPLGKIFGACVTIVGVGMVALPAGILASAFSDELRQRREQYATMVDEALQDGVIDQHEERQLAKSRLDLGIDSNDAASIEKRAGQCGTCPHCGELLETPPE